MKTHKEGMPAMLQRIRCVRVLMAKLVKML